MGGGGAGETIARRQTAKTQVVLSEYTYGFGVVTSAVICVRMCRVSSRFHLFDSPCNLNAIHGRMCVPDTSETSIFHIHRCRAHVCRSNERKNVRDDYFCFQMKNTSIA